MWNNGEKYRYKCGSCVNLQLHCPIGSDSYKCVRKWGKCKILEKSCSMEWPYEFDEKRDYDEVDRLVRRGR